MRCPRPAPRLSGTRLAVAWSARPNDHRRRPPTGGLRRTQRCTMTRRRTLCLAALAWEWMRVAERRSRRSRRSGTKFLPYLIRTAVPANAAGVGAGTAAVSRGLEPETHRTGVHAFNRCDPEHRPNVRGTLWRRASSRWPPVSLPTAAPRLHSVHRCQTTTRLARMCWGVCGRGVRRLVSDQPPSSHRGHDHTHGPGRLGARGETDRRCVTQTAPPERAARTCRSRTKLSRRHGEAQTRSFWGVGRGVVAAIRTTAARTGVKVSSKIWPRSWTRTPHAMAARVPRWPNGCRRNKATETCDVAAKFSPTPCEGPQPASHQRVGEWADRRCGPTSDSRRTAGVPGRWPKRSARPNPPYGQGSREGFP